jgi:hypothetical protein
MRLLQHAFVSVLRIGMIQKSVDVLDWPPTAGGLTIRRGGAVHPSLLTWIRLASDPQ